MEGLTSIQIVLLGLGGIGILVVIIFLIRVNDKGYDYDRILRELNEQQEKDLEELNAGNKEINRKWNFKVQEKTRNEIVW